MIVNLIPASLSIKDLNFRYLSTVFANGPNDCEFDTSQPLYQRLEFQIPIHRIRELTLLVYLSSAE